MKKAADRAGENGKDKVVGNWITISSSDHLFKHDIDVDFEKLNF